MVPFDPIALLAMLQAFYPVVGPAAFARARIERPNYFAAGRIVGSSGDALQLPDGRIFDCIFMVNDPFGRSRWQCIDVTTPGTPDDDPFRLEPGPIVPVDLSAYPEPHPTPVFVPLMGEAMIAMGDSEGVLLTAFSTVAEHSSKTPMENAHSREMEPAESQLGIEGWALNPLDPSDVLMQVLAGGYAIDAERGNYDEPPPPDLPDVPPGPPPPGDPDPPRQPA